MQRWVKGEPAAEETLLANVDNLPHTSVTSSPGALRAGAQEWRFAPNQMLFFVSHVLHALVNMPRFSSYLHNCYCYTITICI